MRMLQQVIFHTVGEFSREAVFVRLPMLAPMRQRNKQV